MKRFFFFLSCIFIWGISPAVAQSDFRPGYIIKSSGDTLWGQIDYRGDYLMGIRCRFIPKGETAYVDYSPADLKGYRFNDGKFFISKEVDGNTHFLEFLVKGKVNFYYLRTNSSSDNYYVENDSLGIKLLPSCESVLIEREGKEYFYKPKNYVGVLKCFMENAPEMAPHIEKLENYDAESLINLDRKYHQMICEGDKCIIYKKKLPIAKILFEPVIGTLNFNWNEAETNVKNHYMGSGLLVNVWMPSLNEKIFFRTGIRLADLKNINEGKTDVGIERLNDAEFKVIVPLQVEYVYPKGKVRPKFAIGVNIYNYLGYVSPSYMAGANVNITKRLGISLSCDVDFTHTDKMLFIPGENLSYGFFAGVLLNLGKLD